MQQFCFVYGQEIGHTHQAILMKPVHFKTGCIYHKNCIECFNYNIIRHSMQFTNSTMKEPKGLKGGGYT